MIHVITEVRTKLCASAGQEEGVPSPVSLGYESDSLITPRQGRDGRAFLAERTMSAEAQSHRRDFCGTIAHFLGLHTTLLETECQVL